MYEWRTDISWFNQLSSEQTIKYQILLTVDMYSVRERKGKFEVDHSQEWKGKTSCQLSYNNKVSSLLPFHC